MARIFSPRTRITTWRRIWLALAETEHELGLGINENQLQQLRDALNDIDFEAASEHEKTLRHDVMAHVHTYGEKAPDARGIIHLGATSQDVVCNADLIIFREALELISRKLALIVHQLGAFAQTWRALPTLGFTHYQPAQPTTVGRRAVMWAQDFTIALAEIEDRLAGMRLRGMRGATGTQASFLGLFDGDEAKVDELERRVAQKLGWEADGCWSVSGQTYPRLVDVQLLSALSTAAAAVHKTCNDIRLLANLRELQEPIERTQIGSSAMAYKRNPMRCERATGLSRFVISLWQNGVDTASTQWMERTLDDSSNRRLSLPESFLALDNALDIMGNVTNGLVVNQAIIHANLQRELPFMATEDLMLAAANLGADRQDAHELIRTHSRAVAKNLMDGSTTNDLLERLATESVFEGVDMASFSDQSRFVGRAPEQVDRFITEIVAPIRARYEASFPETAELSV